MKLYVGIDLHSNNNYTVILTGEGKIVYKKRLPNDLNLILSEFSAYKDDISAIVIESTFNWYWLVDALTEFGFPVHLANPSHSSNYCDAKYTDDYTDAKNLAELIRLGKLKEGYIYPKEKRSLRELLRRRLRLVQQRTMILLSLQAMINRNTGNMLKSDEIKALNSNDAKSLLEDKNLLLITDCQIKLLKTFSEQIDIIEKAALKQIRPNKPYKLLKTIPGVGEILAMTILLEAGDINRFKGAGHYCSYCRCVKSEKWSNGKKKGKNNRKNGNRYLSWAYMEGANYAIRYSQKVKKYYQRKLSRRCRVVALKSIAAKLSKASYFIMKEGIKFEIAKSFV